MIPIADQVKLYTTLLRSKNDILLRESVGNGVLCLSAIRAYIAAEQFLTTDPTTQKTKDMAITLATRNECVLVTGESGTGKELIANTLHGGRVGEFIAVNSCAVTDTLFESELFGHERGAFTGATSQRDGLLKATEGSNPNSPEEGTLFLDEIGDMPLHLQPKLLRVVQQRTYRRVGGNTELPVKCRIVIATHQNLKNLVMLGKFRRDLYERLCVFELHIPPLRERLGDTELHLPHPNYTNLVAKIHDCYGRRLTILPGNVRQLLNLKLRFDVFGIEAITEESIL